MLTVRNYGTNEFEFTAGVVYEDGFVSEWSDVEKKGILSTKYNGAITEKVFLIFHESYLVDKANPPPKGDIVSFNFPSPDSFGEVFTEHTLMNITVTKRRS